MIGHFDGLFAPFPPFSVDFFPNISTTRRLLRRKHTPIPLPVRSHFTLFPTTPLLPSYQCGSIFTKINYFSPPPLCSSQFFSSLPPHTNTPQQYAFFFSFFSIALNYILAWDQLFSYYFNFARVFFTLARFECFIRARLARLARQLIDSQRR